MKVKKWVTCDHEVEIDISSDDIEVISGELQDNFQEDNFRRWLIQMNDIAIFLEGVPKKILREFSAKQADAIARGLRKLADRLGEEHA